ncbi:hypothetical protein BDZ85DRAFT_268670 [Elsinoe ampelina]|uniref:Uncharacterized protein n=1 Tax=Elsinoe ampelina TaxID=302913 RepID=A0A6A6G2C3_9PEZI|nr:hypothetical protein BDZ85DRAFT_268670 [Elsinoe ampelina]
MSLMTACRQAAFLHASLFLPVMSCIAGACRGVASGRRFCLFLPVFSSLGLPYLYR